VDSKLDGLRVAILATDGFEQVELTDPREALEDAGAITAVVYSMTSRPSIGKCLGCSDRTRRVNATRG
jgi:putative intracellular protease/amidase